MVEQGILAVVISDTLLSEVKDVFNRLFGKKAGTFSRFYTESFPNKVRVREHQIQEAKQKLNEYAKKEDLDHLAAAKVGGADFLVTTDSELLQSRAREIVQTLTPKRLLQLLGLRSYETKHEE